MTAPCLGPVPDGPGRSGPVYVARRLAELGNALGEQGQLGCKQSKLTSECFGWRLEQAGSEYGCACG
ncbi:hypothetical protein AB0L59_41170 [Streptomyces sp. NPDC052109]|uniref:hypothetical protein n=1 Tax=Streptomyces sp. NPDC052109 TaxID=3155527 RepID=UPI00343AC4DC